jgi:hypothetical protein
VQIATTGNWNDQEIGLTGGAGPNFNHAKIGVSISGDHNYAIFGDMNQQGSLSTNCKSSQNGRGGFLRPGKQAAVGQRQRPHRGRDSVDEITTEKAQGPKVTWLSGR